MTKREVPTPGQPAPDLEFPVLGPPEDRWDIAQAKPAQFSLLIFYRGLHCPVCRKYLQEFEALMDTLAELGVEAVALSMDDAERARRARDEWNLRKLPVGYDLSEKDAWVWGLFVSESIKDEEPRRFSEPGLFLVNSDRTLYYAAINSMPFGRPKPDDVLDAVRFIEDKDYPPRGEVRAA